jgi:ABC-type cobalamin/Fe3+-siderophores transport system ATPase subunit
MIKNIKLKFGRAPDVAAETIQTSAITVFVGPNNAGKSKVLQELVRYCQEGTENVADVILERVEFEPFTKEAAEQHIARVTLKPQPNETLRTNHVIVGKRQHRHQLPREELVNKLVDPNTYPNQFCSWYLGYNTLMLNGLNRINLVNPQQAGDLQAPPQTSFQVLFRDNAKRSEVRRIVHDAFSLFLILDPTNLGQLRLRLAAREPVSEMEERGIHEEAVQYQSSAMLIDYASDGVKALTGIITETIAGDPIILLIDEPEAFLHPALAFLLGKEMAQTSASAGKRLFVSTHSANFVMGCLQSGAAVNIVRLTYSQAVPTARLLPSRDILRLMRNPLLRSTGVLAGLFYEFVVVTESDTDRAFYQEINERLLRYKSAYGIPNCLFLNAQNKQTVRTIIRPLRELGIATAGIVDIDVLKEGGTVWTDFLGSGFVPEIEQQSLGALRAAINKKFEGTGKNMKRDGGLDLLDKGDREAGDNLFDRLAQYGLFVVRRGEIESWLTELGATGHGPAWLINIFETMGEDPDQGTYIKPADGDVWGFIKTVKAWLVDPQRRGIPA